MTAITGEELVSYVDHFRARVLQDALLEATEAYWLRRADQFAAVGTPACEEIAQACRNRAAVSLIPGVITAELWEELKSVAAGLPPRRESPGAAA